MGFIARGGGKKKEIKGLNKQSKKVAFYFEGKINGS